MIAVSIDGVLVDPSEAKISIFDRGFLYGDGLFEVLRTWDGVAVDLEAHLDRMCASADVMENPIDDRDKVAEYVRRTIAAAGDGEHRLRIIVTRGAGSIAGRRPVDPGKTIVVVEPLGELPATISLAIVDYPLPRRTGAAHKTLAFLDNLIARELAERAGADEGVRLGPDGDVVECAMANLFIVTTGGPAAPVAPAIPPKNVPDAITGEQLEGVGGPTVITPPVTGILPGITRGYVIAACAAKGIAVREQRISVDDLRAADEIFVTSSVRGVVPVTALDGEPRRAGPISQQLAEAIRFGRASQTKSSPNG